MPKRQEYLPCHCSGCSWKKSLGQTMKSTARHHCGVSSTADNEKHWETMKITVYGIMLQCIVIAEGCICWLVWYNVTMHVCIELSMEMLLKPCKYKLEGTICTGQSSCRIFFVSSGVTRKIDLHPQGFQTTSPCGSHSRLKSSSAQIFPDHISLLNFFLFMALLLPVAILLATPWAQTMVQN